MRDIFLLSIIAFFTAKQTAAQSSDKHGFVKYGIKAGVHFTCMNFNKGFPEPAVPVANSWKPGYTGGLFMEVPLQHHLSLRPEYLFARMKGEDKKNTTGYSMNYVSLPVLLKYQLLPAIAIMAGPQFDMLINASKNINGEKSTVTHDTEERNFGITGAIEFKLIKSLYLEARYMHGLNHIGIGQRSSTTEFIYQLAQVNVSWKLSEP